MLINYFYFYFIFWFFVVANFVGERGGIIIVVIGIRIFLFKKIVGCRRY
jgi:hypothetical protein